MKRSLFYICIILSTLTSKLTYAQQYDSSMQYHFIIAFDKAGCEWNKDFATAAAIKKILFSSYSDSGLLDRNQLFQSGDYISFVGFAIDSQSEDMEVFALPMSSNGEQRIFQSMTVSELQSFIGSSAWQAMIGYRKMGGSIFSLVSVAKPYSLMALRSTDTLYSVNRTFIITITDHRYNGNDFYDELNAFEQFANHRKSLSADTICQKAYKVSQYYYAKYMKTHDIGRKKYAELYEFVPLQQHFTLSNILEYPKQIEAHMKRGGYYEINMYTQQIKNPLFRIEHFEMYLDSVKENTYISPNNTKDISSNLNGDNMTLTFHKSQNIQALKMRAWVRMTDGVYGHTVLTPSKYSPAECGRDGLNVSIPIVYEKPMKIFNIIPLYTWSWLPCFKTQSDAIMFWQIAIPFIIIFFLWLSVFYVKPYTPQKGDFKLVDKQ